MAVVYTKNPQTGKFEKVGPAGAVTDASLSLPGQPADAQAVGDALTWKVSKADGKDLSTNDFTDDYKASLDELLSHSHNVFSSLTEIGITTFPTTMKAVSEAMPSNSMIIIDTRRVNGVETGYNTETISDWGNEYNGTAMIVKGLTTARVGMMILYGTTQTSVARIFYGSYAHDANKVNWVDMDSVLGSKLDKFIVKNAVDLNTITEPGMYFVSSGTTALNFPIGVNGHLLVMNNGSGTTRQLFMRFGTADVNNYQWYTRTSSSTGWSKWWMICGQEKVWNGGTVLNSEINVGSRYGCQSWLVVARLQSTGALSSVVIPRAFLTTDPNAYGRWQIADEECWISFTFCYKDDDNVYIKVIDQTNSEYTTLKYVYRIT